MSPGCTRRSTCSAWCHPNVLPASAGSEGSTAIPTWAFPGSSEALFLCEKTDELRDDADLSDVVTPHRPR